MKKKILLILYSSFSVIFHFFFNKEKFKLWFELNYWKVQKFRESEFTNFHYREFFIDYFKLEENFYKGKKILDLGCGPRGSLEWATNAKERIGLDPLANKYLKLNQGKHEMTYVEGKSEAIPFDENYFDVISSFNSLDHVEDVYQTISEIARCLKKDGLFLLITDIHERPTLTEPSAFSWEIVAKIKPFFEIISEEHYEGNKLYKSIRKGIKFNHKNAKSRYGVLTLVGRRK